MPRLIDASIEENAPIGPRLEVKSQSAEYTPLRRIASFQSNFLDLLRRKAKAHFEPSTQSPHTISCEAHPPVRSSRYGGIFLVAAIDNIPRASMLERTTVRISRVDPAHFPRSRRTLLEARSVQGCRAVPLSRTVCVAVSEPRTPSPDQALVLRPRNQGFAASSAIPRESIHGAALRAHKEVVRPARAPVQSCCYSRS